MIFYSVRHVRRRRPSGRRTPLYIIPGESFHTPLFILVRILKLNSEISGQWQNRIENAFEHLTHHAIRSGVEKVINVWDTRTVFDKESIEKMKTVLATAKANHKGIYIKNHRFCIYQF